MAISNRQKIEDAVGQGNLGVAFKEIADAIDEGDNAAPAANVAAMAASADLVGVDGVGSNAAPLVETEARLDALEAKINELLAAVKAAGQMEAD